MVSDERLASRPARMKPIMIAMTTCRKPAFVTGRLSVMGAFRTAVRGQRLWVISEADRSSTTILTSEEY